MGSTDAQWERMNRSDLKKLATTRLRDAEVLYANGRYAGAYYLAGYAVECALKACIARNVKRGDFPDKETVMRSYTHNLQQLVVAADLSIDLIAQSKSDPNFAANWALTKDWKETSRYQLRKKIEARDLIEAVGDRHSGVLIWLMKYW